MARSLAFWFDEENHQSMAQLHFNYWVLKSDKIKYLDIGVKFKFEPKPIFNSINFYLPFDKDAIEYVSGLGETVCSNDELLTGIFNTQVKGKASIGNKGAHKMELGEAELIFFTNLEEETAESQGGVVLEKQNDTNGDGKGFTLSFPAQLFELPQNIETALGCEGYFRFRIVIKASETQESISRVSASKGAKLLGHLETTELVDFRVNEVRNLPKKVKQYLPNEPVIKAVHFFLIRDAKSEYKIAHQDFSRCRLLENDLWQSYLACGDSVGLKLPENMLIYHWKEIATENKKIEHFSAFAKFTQWLPSIKTQLIVIGWVILFGAFGSLLAGFLEVFFQSLKTVIEYVYK